MGNTMRRRRPDEKALRVRDCSKWRQLHGVMVVNRCGSVETSWRWSLTAGWKQSHFMTALISLLHTRLRLTLLLYFQIRDQQAWSHHLCISPLWFMDIGPHLIMFAWKSSNFLEFWHKITIRFIERAYFVLTTLRMLEQTYAYVCILKHWGLSPALRLWSFTG